MWGVGMFCGGQGYQKEGSPPLGQIFSRRPAQGRPERLLVYRLAFRTRTRTRTIVPVEPFEPSRHRPVALQTACRHAVRHGSRRHTARGDRRACDRTTTDGQTDRLDFDHLSADEGIQI